MRVAAKAFDFEIAIPGIECVTERGRWLRRTLKTEHALVPSGDGEPVCLLAHVRGASRYGLRWMAFRAQRDDAAFSPQGTAMSALRPDANV